MRDTSSNVVGPLGVSPALPADATIMLGELSVSAPLPGTYSRWLDLCRLTWQAAVAAGAIPDARERFGAVHDAVTAANQQVSGSGE